jgi:hypothetical protein
VFGRNDPREDFQKDSRNRFKFFVEGNGYHSVFPAVRRSPMQAGTPGKSFGSI